MLSLHSIFFHQKYELQRDKRKKLWIKKNSDKHNVIQEYVASDICPSVYFFFCKKLFLFRTLCDMNAQKIICTEKYLDYSLVN